MEIGIIGLGVAGISILKEIDRQADKDTKEQLKITVFSKDEGFGTGFPYQPDDEALLINQYTETMSIDPDDHRDFLNWIRRTKKLDHLEKTHLPRYLFGEYLFDISRELMNKLNVTVVREEVTDIVRQENDQYRIKTCHLEKTVDSVHLSIGHLAYQDPYGLKDQKNYIHNPYPAERNLNFPDEPVKVAVIGTGLTAIDAYLYIRKYYPKARLTFLSLDERFASVRAEEPETENRYLRREKVLRHLQQEKGELTLDHVRVWFEKEAQEQNIDLTWVWKHLGEGTIEGLKLDLDHLEELGRFQAIIHNMRDCYTLLWNALSDNEKDRFLKQYSRKWAMFKAPIPQRTAYLLIKEVSEGMVRVFSGIQSIRKEKQSFKVTFDDLRAESFDFIVNGTGQQKDLTKQLALQQPLIRKLVASGLLAPCRYGGILIDYPAMTAVSSDGEALGDFRIYGQLVSGIQFGNSSVELVAKSAEHGVKDMLGLGK
ncbi:MAG: FAD/NAD(P)-binding protein [Alkalibacterium sp.]|nr:FAD/NAD(P)-binding protein [Alkalibacterium sp.]